MTYLVSGAIAIAAAVAFGSARSAVEGFVVAMTLVICSAGATRGVAQTQLNRILTFQGLRTLLTLDSMGGPAFRTPEDREASREHDARYERDGAALPGVGATIVCAILLQVEAAIGFVYVAATTWR